MHAATLTIDTAATLTVDRFVDDLYQPAGFVPKWLLFAAMLAFVGGVSVYDGYLVLRTGQDIQVFEKNPAGLWLIECNHGDPALFLIAKGAGTLLVLAVLVILYRRWQRIAVPIASALLVFQAGLLIFLESA